jgi:hypothetical protein
MTDLLPGMPEAYEGHPIRWGPWTTPGVALCGRTTDMRCEGCGAAGLVTAASTGGGELRFNARHCPACGWLVVHWRKQPAPGERAGKIVRIVERKGTP